MAKAIGYPEKETFRITVGRSLLSDEMLNQVGILVAVGFANYEKLSKVQKEKISEAIGAVGGGALGFAAIGVAIAGLAGNAAGGAAIVARLAGLGGFVGQGLFAGVCVATAFPVAAGVAGFGVVKGVKHLVQNRKLKAKGIDPH